MDYTQILNETKNYTFVESRSVLNETTVVFGPGVNESALATRLAKVFAQVLVEDVSPLDKIERFITSLEFELSLVKKSDKSTPRTVFLDHEMKTWKLMLYLTQTRLNFESCPMDVQEVLENNYSDHAIIQQLKRANCAVQELITIKKWLEQTYSTCSSNMDRIPPCGSQFLENTLLAGHLENDESGFHFDLDVERGDNVNNNDTNNHASFMRFSFALLRSGKMAELDRLAFELGFGWLPAALEGRKLLDDPNYAANSKASNQVAISGNAFRDLWMRVCSENCRNAKVGLYERAVYAFCCGNLEVLLSVSKTWQDRLWSHVVHALTAAEEYHIKLFKTSDSTECVAHEPDIDFRDIIMKVEAGLSEVANETGTISAFFRSLQAAIILNSLEESFASRLNTFDQVLDIDIDLMRLRFSSSISVIVSEMFEVDNRDSLDRFVCLLCEKLAYFNQFETLVDFIRFTSKPESFCCKVLMQIKSAQMRDTFLKTVKENGLDSAAVRKELITIYEHNYVPVESDADGVSKEEQLLVDSVLNLRYSSTSPVEFLCSVNCLARKFVGVKRYLTANALFSGIPLSVIDDALQHNRSVTFSSGTELPPREKNIVREFVCLRNAVLILGDLDLIRQATGNEGANCDDGDEAFEESRNGLIAVLDKVYEVLMLEGDWLIDLHQVSLDDDYFTEERRRQMELVRSIVVPDVTIRSIMLLKHYSLYSLIQDLFTCVVNDDSNLVSLFTAEQTELVYELVDMEVLHDVF